MNLEGLEMMAVLAVVVLVVKVMEQFGLLDIGHAGKTSANGSRRSTLLCIYF